ncbi:hypothetical protein [Dyadobacter bucti]|uniref:hypothetical protein n=1 Tax=Dyadobacter bucti TaxID=2572203 RepID=UPI003F724635
MKRYASTLVLFTFILSSVVLSSCKKEEIDPDLSKVFVGSWEGELVVEDGYESKTDWVITRISDNSVRIESTYNFIAKDPKYTSRTSKTTLENISLSTTVANSVTLHTTDEIETSNDVIAVKGTGIVVGRTLTVSSTGTYKKTGVVVTPPSQKFTKR